MCPWTWGKVCGIRTRSWRLATPRNTLENDDFTDLRILGGRARSGGRVSHASKDRLTAGDLYGWLLLRSYTADAGVYERGTVLPDPWLEGV